MRSQSWALFVHSLGPPPAPQRLQRRVVQAACEVPSLGRLFIRSWSAACDTGDLKKVVESAIVVNPLEGVLLSSHWRLWASGGGWRAEVSECKDISRKLLLCASPALL